MHTCSTWSEDVHGVLGLSSHYFLSTFSTFLTYFFPGPISIGIDNVGATPPRINLKLCIFVLHGLKMCVWFLGYPPII